MTLDNPAWLPLLDDWKNKEYDGIKGFPPKWIPMPNIKEFQTARGIIGIGVMEGKYNYDEIKLRFDKLVGDKNYILVLALMKDRKVYDHHLFYLVKLYEASLLSETDGLLLLGGKVAVMGSNYSKNQSSRAKEPRKLTETHKRNIRNKYIKAQNEDCVYGAVKALSTEYDVTTRQISNVVQDLVRKRIRK